MFKYSINKQKLPEEIREKVIEYGFDEETKNFVTYCSRRRVSSIKVWLFRFLKKYMDIYNIHALLGMYTMRLLSEKQWRELSGGDKRTLLDVGAGQGFVTENAINVFKNIAVNEFYYTMRRRLRRKGFRIVGGNFEKGISRVTERFDVVSLLNVIDRCEKPVTLIKNCASLLKDDGLLIIADPLPFNQIVLRHGKSAEPKERLPKSDDKSFEASFTAFYKEVLEPNGLIVQKLTRLPYLSQSDGAKEPIVVYDDMVVVCSRRK